MAAVAAMSHCWPGLASCAIFSPLHSSRGPVSRLPGCFKLDSASRRPSVLRLGNTTEVGRIWSELGVRLGTKSNTKDKLLDKEMDSKVNYSTGVRLDRRAFLGAAVPLMPLFPDVEEAHAANGEFGLLEGRSFALVHPLVMGALFLYTIYAGYLGWQWRRVRTIQTDINELKKEIKILQVAAVENSAAPSTSPAEFQILSLTEERKELVKAGYRDKHFNAGSILLGLGVLESVGGSLNTWFRTGKLFPGPHLFAGAGITICWALAAALVPAMQKGNETARNLHIGLNLINVVLFIWQIPTGWEIVLKVFEFTNWP